MPTIFYTRVLDDSRNTRSEEILRRFVNVTPNATKEKVQEANRITFKRYGLLPEEYGDQVVSKDDKQRAKMIVGDIVDLLKSHTAHLGVKESGVRILFEETLSHAMPSDDVFQMTVSDRMARYLAIITKVKMSSRAKFVHRKTGAFYPIATYGDLKEAFSLMEMGGSNIRPYLVVMYNEVIYPLYSQIDEPRTDKDENGNVIARERYKGLRVQEIIEGSKEILGSISAKEMYNKYLTPMVELSLLNWQKSIIKGSEKIFMPSNIEASKVFSMFPDTKDLKLEVSDKAYWPSKESIEQSYGSGSKLSSERGGKNIFDIYRLEDHEGNEITISELIDRYLSDPETCFKVGWDEMEASDVRFAVVSPANHNQSYATQIIINHLHNA